MTFTLVISMNNAAFIDELGDWRPEAARILREAAQSVEDGIGVLSKDIRDINGNLVGKWRVT